MIEGTYESSDRKCAGAVQPMPVLAEFATACCWTSWSNLRRGTSPNAVSKCFKPMICQPRINWINVSVISEIGSVSRFFWWGYLFSFRPEIWWTLSKCTMTFGDFPSETKSWQSLPPQLDGLPAWSIGRNPCHAGRAPNQQGSGNLKPTGTAFWGLSAILEVVTLSINYDQPPARSKTLMNNITDPRKANLTCIRVTRILGIWGDWSQPWGVSISLVPSGVIPTR